MESSNTGTGAAPVPFMLQLLRNNMLLLSVLLAVAGVVYFAVGVYMLIGR